MERAQARDLALQGRRLGGRLAVAAERELGDEVGEAGMVERAAGRAPSGAASPRTAAGRTGRRRACCATGHARTRGRRGSRAGGARRAGREARRWPRRGASPPRRGAPFRATRRSARAAAELEQPDQRLRVAHLVDQRVELGERARLDVDALVLVRLGLGVRQPGGEVDVALLVGEAGRGVEGVQVLPVLGRLADLLGELPLGGLQRLLALDVELAGGQLEQVGRADRLARLAGRGRSARRRGRPRRRRPGGGRCRASPPRRPRGGRSPDARRRPSPRTSSPRRRVRSASSCRRRLVDQGQRDVEHALERGDRDALGRLVVALGAVGEVHARQPCHLERVGVRAAAGDDPPRLVAARAQRRLGDLHDGRARLGCGSRRTAAPR